MMKKGDGMDNAIFQKPLHYQHKNLWSGRRVENLIKLYVLCFCALHLVSLSFFSYFDVDGNFYLVEKFPS